MKRLLRIDDVAALLDCSTKTVRRLVGRGVIPTIQPGGHGTSIRFDEDDVHQAIRNVSNDPGNSDFPAETKESKKLSGPTPRWKKTINSNREVKN